MVINRVVVEEIEVESDDEDEDFIVNTDSSNRY